MTNQTREQGRETLEELASQVIGSREEMKISIRTKFEQEWPARWEEEKKLRLYQDSDITEEDEKELDLDVSLSMGLREYDNFKKYVENIANPTVFSELTKQDRRNLLKLISIREEKPLFEKGLFAQQKLRYYLDLRENQPLQNVAQLDPFTFGKTGFPRAVYGHFDFDPKRLYYLGKRSYEKLCDRMKTEVPRIYNSAKKTITEWAQNGYETPLTFYRVGAKELAHSDKGNAGTFDALISFANSFANSREMNEQEWNSINSIKEVAIKINKWNKKRYYTHRV